MKFVIFTFMLSWPDAKEMSVFSLPRNPTFRFEIDNNHELVMRY